MAKRFGGAIFDVDGMLVDSPHEKAWREGLHQLMEGDWSDIREQTSYSPEAFTPQVYQREMSGKPRYKGAQAALEYFVVTDAEERAKEYGDRKQEMIVELIEAKDFKEYPNALHFVLALKEAAAISTPASSSKNAGAFLRLVRLDEFAEKEGLSYDFLRPGYTLLDVLDGDFSGRDFEQGKLRPEIFLIAAEELGISPEDNFVGGRGERGAGREGGGDDSSGHRAGGRRGGALRRGRGPRGNEPRRRVRGRALPRPSGGGERPR